MYTCVSFNEKHGSKQEEECSAPAIARLCVCECTRVCACESKDVLMCVYGRMVRVMSKWLCMCM